MRLRCLASMADVDELVLKQELIHFAKCHKHLGKSSVTGTENRESEEDEAFDPDEGLRVCKGNCSNCMGSILTLLTGYRYQCRSYNKLYKCLRTAFTLLCNVVSCERSFSKLRFVKSRLRSLIGLLESLLLCSVESDLLKAIDNNTVYRKRSVNSPELRKLLMYS